MRRLALTLLLLITPAAAHAEVRATLPLAGYYRTGMCMPVRVEGGTPLKALELRADGALSTIIDAREGRISAVVPFLAVRAIDGVTVNGVKVDTRLLVVPDGTRLIGTALSATRPSPAADAADVVFVALDPLDPVPGPAMAWEAMDELVVEAAGATRLGEEKLLALLAVGVDVVVPGEARPTVNVPWQREGDGWALRYEPLGPRGSVFVPAMVPVAGWQPGLPQRTRRQALLAAVLFAILATAVAMSRTRRAILASAALVTVSLIAISAWQSWQPKVRWMQGTIAIQSGPFTQRDEWRYGFATEPQAPKLLIEARVVADSPEALLAQTSLLQHGIPRGRWVALLSRTVSTEPATGAVDGPPNSPLDPLVTAGYLRPGVTVVGQITEGPWPTVVLRTTDR